MEWITRRRRDRTPAGPDPARTRTLLASYFEQLRDVIGAMVQAGLVHGDLSAYNLLAAGERLVVIDLPQVVDLVGNPSGMDFLLRDCANVCAWFRSRGLDVDEHDLFGDADGARVLTRPDGRRIESLASAA